MKLKSNENNISNKPISRWIEEFPLLEDMMSYTELLWPNTYYSKSTDILEIEPISMADITDASNRLERFAPYIMKAFPETAENNGLIESPLKEIDSYLNFINSNLSNKIDGSLYLKCDSHLPISGSIKARGGIYEILKHAETLAIENGMLTYTDDYSKLAESEFQRFFSQYSIAVGSTGNLGLSIGIISAKLGFKVTVHMSSDAKQWKKNLLRSKGVTVIEYDSDYSIAVAEGRKESQNNPKCHFVDDEKSKDLFLGYAVAALRLKSQLASNNIIVDEAHPLFVYLPCGVGGGPGGVAFGLKKIFGDNVHCFFAEPTHSPCVLLGLMTDMHDSICVQDFGIDNKTAADGLAVGRASALVCSLMRDKLSGCFSLHDDTMYSNLSLLSDTENIKLEPSALAGLSCVPILYNSDTGREYLSLLESNINDSNITHIAWATGGNMVPDEELKLYYSIGKRINESIQ